MLRRIILSAGLLIAAGATPAQAQSPRVTVDVFFGWAFSDGVYSDQVLAADGNLYDRIEPEDSGSFGFSAGALVTENAEVGFIYNQQFSSLLIGGTTDRTIGDLSVSSYHGYFGYNWGDADAPIRPFMYGGLGATNYGNVEFTGTGGIPRETGGETQFSTTWGGGVRIFPSPRVGVRLGASWTPTYIKTDSAGWWCDPYWGCYLVGNAQYANQLQLSGGVAFRF